MCEKTVYKGISVYHNYHGSKFNKPYWSAVNEHVRLDNLCNPHTHAESEGVIHKIIDCYSQLRSTGRCKKSYNRSIRCKAMRLFGFEVKFI